MINIMREIIKQDTRNIEIKIPSDYVLRKQNEGTIVLKKISQYLEKAYDLFYQFAEPASLVEDISYLRFKWLYSGEGKNEFRTPLDDIMVYDASYFIFAMTLGNRVSQLISDMFKNGKYLLGQLLDQVCSAGIEGLADNIANKYLQREIALGKLMNHDVMLRYSPGYCGWHITGQKILHQYIHSSDIGISLTENCYMLPIKSISGVMIGGIPEIHNFNNNYSFCRICRTRNCRERLALIL